MSLFGWLSALFDPDDTAWSSYGNADTGLGMQDDAVNDFSVNPATGLPMMGNSMLDVGGNPFGTNVSDFGHDHASIGGGINPASGLPLIGDSMIDVAGNPYGFDSLHDHSAFDHYHHDSWSDFSA